ncbi:MAG TPA: DEAD/DEAH box helicase [Bacteroidales bacterium]|nr:DEAD/DEAH box helicase [Bacteroidales bacterium]HPS17178.1 DEAD/DEAH box helicase [Bacteroidales bacterium]
MNFKEFGFNPQLLEGIEALGFETATPIQEQAIPVILEGKDLIASAQTGTGKTAAFLLPVINKIISSEQDNNVHALVIVPTRELAIQIDQYFQGFSYFTPVKSIAVYGGTDGISYSQEQQALSEGADVVICTPGRMISHLNGGYVKFSEVKFLILDEADRMLDMGFYDDIMKIISFLPAKRQNLLFAATMPEEMRNLAKKVLINPAEINIAVSKPAERILQAAYIVYDKQKIPLIKELLLNKQLRSVLIFCSTKLKTKQLSSELKKLGISVEDIHSDLDQQRRENALLNFKSRKLQVLVATDILSRGIDIEDIDLVINFDVPNDYEDYIHRIGRTARAETDGVAITFVDEKEQSHFASIEKLLEKSIYKIKLPEHIGEGPIYNPYKSRQGKEKKFRSRKK